jgi:cellobiose phosphorylase
LAHRELRRTFLLLPQQGCSPEQIVGREAPPHGEAENSWLAEVAAWNHVTFTQWIVGIRPTLDGLEIAPVIRSQWNGSNVIRHFGGFATY